MLLLALLVLTTGCAKRDEIPPSVNLAAPLDNSTFVSGTEVLIVGTATDNERVSSVGAILQNVSNGQMAGSGWGIPGTDGSFNFSMELGDRYTPTGLYLLRVTAYDEEGNPASDFAEINLFELPKTLHGVYFAGEDASGSATAFYVDTAGQVSVGPYIGQELTVFKADNRYQSLLTGGKSGPVQALDVYGMSPLFSIDLPSGFDPVPLRGLGLYSRQLFVGSGNQPYIQRYTNEGLSSSIFDQAFYPPTALVADSIGLYASLSSPDGLNHKIDRYDRSHTGLQASHNLSWSGEFVAVAGSDAVMVGANAFGTGRVLILDKNDLSIRDSINLQENIHAVEGVGNRLFILGPGGAFELDVNSGSTSGLICTGFFTSMAFEPVQELLYMGKDNSLEVYQLDGTLVNSIPGTFGDVTEIEFHYNK